MGKIRLRLESLAVESFGTLEPERAGGTVVAHQLQTRGCSAQASCYASLCTCPEIGTCLPSCNGTCFQYSCQAPTCVDTCATCAENTCVPTCDPGCTGWC